MTPDLKASSWVPFTVEPESPGRYLVVQGDGVYTPFVQFTRMYTPEGGWQDTKPKKYGPVVFWQPLPPFPAPQP